MPPKIAPESKRKTLRHGRTCNFLVGIMSEDDGRSDDASSSMLVGLVLEEAISQRGRRGSAGSQPQPPRPFFLCGRPDAGRKGIGYRRDPASFVYMRLAVTSLSAPIISSRLGGNNRGNNKLGIQDSKRV